MITQAQEINVGVQRAQYEHAIAMLIGRPPAELSIGPRPLAGTMRSAIGNPAARLRMPKPDCRSRNRFQQTRKCFR